jgi:secreted Zn-dependent insulinase-like peptidase
MFHNLTRRHWHWAGLLLVALFTVACAQQSQLATDTEVPVQSPADDKAYRYIQLDNGLRALLISDPNTEKAAAALDVYVGSASNPADRGGLAHFLEHMLFLGTEKYPDSGEYARFISEHGGSRNAYTAFEHTNYFFDIDQAYLKEALDRFAQFFISPRFDAEYVQREVNAVDAEYHAGLTSDGRRNLDVMREIVHPEHPYSILGVGTRETLADRPGAPVRDDLLKFYDRYYSANLMALVVLGREDLDALEAMVESMFSPVPNHGVSIADIDVPLYAEGSLPMEVYIRPEASQRQLELSFPMPNYSDRYRSKPLSYIGNLVGHEGEGSLLSLLKAEGLAEGLGAGSGIAYRGGSAFSISVSLTEAGLAQRDQVVAQVFDYLRMLELDGPQQSLYDEQGQLSALNFRFRENVPPMSYVTALASDMQMLPAEDVLRGNYLMDDYDPALIREILDQYMTPNNVVVRVVGRQVPVDRESKFYFAPYSTHHLAGDEGGWRGLANGDIDKRLYLPAPNEFIADNVELVAREKDNPAVPALVKDSKRLRIWFRQDDEFEVPKGAMYASFRSSRVSETAADAAAAQLYVNLLQDAVNEFTYPALLAGLNFSIYTHSRGISLKVSGYNDKQLILLERIVDSITGAQLDNQRFDNIRADLVRGLENVKTTRAFRQVVGDTRQLMMSGQWSEEQLIPELQAMTPADVQRFADEFWSGAEVDLLLNGNYQRGEVARVRQVLSPLLHHDRVGSPPELRVVSIGTGENYVYTAPIDHQDSVLFWYLQAPDDGLESRALSALTGQIISADFFEDLRTEQQLGYIVSAFAWPLLDVPGVAFMVQSPTASAAELKQAADTFLRKTAVEGAVTEAQFLRHRHALLQEITQPDKNLWEQSAYFWREIARQALDFESRDLLAGAVSTISFDQWRDWYKRVVIEERASLTVVAPGRLGEVPDGETVVSPAAFQAGKPYYERH